MTKRIILCLLIFCMLLILSSCSTGAKDKTPPASAETSADTAAVSGSKEDTLDVLYSISNAFLNVNYHVTVSQAEEYDQIHTEMIKRVSGMTLPSPSGLYNSGLYSYEDIAPDLAERYEALFKQKYQNQPVTDNGFKSIKLTSMTVDLWSMVLKGGSDIKVTSVKTSLRNKDIDGKKNQIDYTVNLIFNKVSYEVTGVVSLVLVDNKWMIDDIYEFTWSPKLSY